MCCRRPANWTKTNHHVIYWTSWSKAIRSRVLTGGHFHILLPLYMSSEGVANPVGWSGLWIYGVLLLSVSNNTACLYIQEKSCYVQIGLLIQNEPYLTLFVSGGKTNHQESVTEILTMMHDSLWFCSSCCSSCESLYSSLGFVFFDPLWDWHEASSSSTPMY